MIETISGWLGIFERTISIVKEAKKSYTERSEVDDSLKEALVGRWHGTVIQEDSLEGVPVEYPVDVSLELNGKSIAGNAEIKIESKGDLNFIELELKGGQYKDRFLRLDYINTKTGSLHFGSFILEISPIPTKMSGRFAGFGAYSNMIISGKIDLSKV